MKFFVKKGRVTIIFNSDFEEPNIEKVLEVVALTLNGVDRAGDWPYYFDMLHANARILKQRVTEKKHRLESELG